MASSCSLDPINALARMISACLIKSESVCLSPNPLSKAACRCRLCQNKVRVIRQFAIRKCRQLQLFVGFYVVLVLQMCVTEHQMSKHAALVGAVLDGITLHSRVGDRRRLLQQLLRHWTQFRRCHKSAMQLFLMRRSDCRVASSRCAALSLRSTFVNIDRGALPQT